MAGFLPKCQPGVGGSLSDLAAGGRGQKMAFDWLWVSRVWGFGMFWVWGFGFWDVWGLVLCETLEPV